VPNGNKIKVSGYAQRVFYNNGIEYRNFSDNLVGQQFTSQGGTALFTIGNFIVTTNIDPKYNKTFKQGTFSQYYTLDDISESNNQYVDINKNLQTQLNIDITNPLRYVWYGNFKEYLRVSLEDIYNRWVASIRVDIAVGAVSGNNVTNFSYNEITNKSSFTIPTKYFINPYGIRFTQQAALVNDSEELNSLRNLTVNYGYYDIEVGDSIHKILEYTGSTTETNGFIDVVVEGNPFTGVTGTTTSIVYDIKPNETQREEFFASIDEFQRNLLNREISPIYTSEFEYDVVNDVGVTVFKKDQFTFPLMDDEYNLDFFSTDYETYLADLYSLTTYFNENRVNLIVRKYTAEIINSFDTIPRCDGDDLTNNGQKATRLLNIYGREFDEVKKYIDGVKFSRVVTYDKKDNTPDSLVKELLYTLGFDQVDFLSNIDLSKNLLPSQGYGELSGTSKNQTLREIDIELNRRLILNMAWLWKSKGARKAVEFLFRFIGAPEALVSIDEFIYIAEKPVDIEKVKRLLYLYTGSVDLSDLPFDDDGYPLPPANTNDMYFQKGGGWYRQTGGRNSSLDISKGNNPHIGVYDGGQEYIAQFNSNCFIPDFSLLNSVFSAHTVLYENLFLNYNLGFVNGMDETDPVFISGVTFNNQVLNDCFTLSATVNTQCPTGCDNTTLLEELYVSARREYEEWVVKLQEDPHLEYSPEWQIIKNNNEIATKNYFREVNAINCESPACLEICFDRIEVVQSDSCDDYNVVQNADTAPFIYFTDENGDKVMFEDFPVCCVLNGGTFKTFVFDDGTEACYCATGAPCNGLYPVGTGVNNGIVLWGYNDHGTNTPPDLTISEDPRVNKGKFDIPIPAITIVSSPECCAWYGYDFQVQDNGQVVCIDTIGDTNTEIYDDSLEADSEAANTSKQLLGPDDPITKELTGIYNTRKTLYDEYTNRVEDPNNQLAYDTDKQTPNPQPGINLNSKPSLYETINSQYIRVSEGVYLKYSLMPQKGHIGTLSDYEDPDLKACSVWEPYTDPNTNEVIFTSLDSNGNPITMNPNSQLYKECCEARGFEIACFVQNDAAGGLVEINCESKNLNKIVKCINREVIPCDEVDEFKIIFGSNQFDGFYLPYEAEGECSVDISMDVMIKYDAERLLECAAVDDCGFNLDIYDNSLYNIKCPNWITFNDNGDAIDLLGQTVQLVETNQVIDWGSIDPNLAVLDQINTSTYTTYFEDSDIAVWQTPGMQDEPTAECCSALGGDLIPADQWRNYQRQIVTNIYDTYQQIVDGEITDQYNEVINGVNIFNSLQSQYNTINNKLLYCVDIPKVPTPTPCFDVTQLITTENVCALGIQTQCGLYSVLLEEYWQLINQVLVSISVINDCIKGNQDTPIISPIEDTEVQKNRVNNEYDKSLSEYNSEIDECNQRLNELSNEINTLIETNGNLQTEISNKTTEILNSNDEAEIETLQNEIIEINGIISQNISLINSLQIEYDDQRQLCNDLETDRQDLTNENKEQNLEFNVKGKEELQQLDSDTSDDDCCNDVTLSYLNTLLNNLYSERDYIKTLAEECYYQSYLDRQTSYQEYLDSGINNTLSFIDDLELCMTLEVGEGFGTLPVTNNQLYSNLSGFTTPVWSFDPYSDYTGVIIESDDSGLLNDVLQSLYQQMLEVYGSESVTENTFSPYWQTVNLTISEEQCQQLGMLYPGQPLYFGLSLKNIECGACILVDNIQVSLETDEIKRKYSTEDCPSFNLRCVIDNKRSWVYNDTGLEERLWSNLEYRYTDYDVTHSDLIVNSKEVAFRIDPAKAIECDVYNFWKQIDCDACTGATNDCLISGTTTVNNIYTLTGDCAYCPSGYVMEADGVTCSETKYAMATINSDVIVTSGNTSYTDFAGGRFYSDITTKPSPVTLTSANQVIDGNGIPVNTELLINNSLWSNRLIDVGVWGSGDTTPANEWVGFSHCISLTTATTFTIAIAADDRVRVKINGDLSIEMNQNTNYNFKFWHMYPITLQAGYNVVEITALNGASTGDTIFGAEIYSGDTSTLSGITSSSGLTAVTVFSTGDYIGAGLPFEVGETIGIGCPSGYVLDKCDISKTRCVSIDKTSVLYDCDKKFCDPEVIEITVNPLDFLDRDPSEIQVKHVLDEMILTNLIDAKSRQTISGYPLLYAFYELYLNATDCGEPYTSKLDYDNLFEFMDSIGDYWTDLIEQVVPATTIWEGCRNSGKIYRNHIFDQNKFAYKRYALNCFNETSDCEIENITSESIGEQRVCVTMNETIIVGDGSLNSENCRNELNIILQQLHNAEIAGDNFLIDQLTEEYNTKLAECESLEEAEAVIGNLDVDPECNTVFITQIYDTNEYEGNIIINGDDEYDTADGQSWMQDNGLINDCNT
jgi:hypothetical protein